MREDIKKIIREGKAVSKIQRGEVNEGKLTRGN